MASHMSAPPTEGEGEPKKRSRLPLIIPLVLLAVAALVYFGGVAAFHVVFMPGTILDGTDVSLRHADEVAEEKAAAFSGYQVHVTGDGVDVTVTAEQVGLAYDGETYAQEAIEATEPWAWPLTLMSRSRDVTAESAIVFDREALLALFEPFKTAARDSAASLGGKAVVFDAESGSYGVDPSVTAQYLDDEALVEVLTQAFLSQTPEVSLGQEQLSGMDDSLHAAADTANSYLKAAGTTLTLNGETVAEVTRDLIVGWITVSDDLTVSLDTNAAAAWASESMGRLNTVGTERTYTRPDGKQVTVSGGSYGWKVSESGVAEALAAAVEAKAPQAIEVPFDQSGQVVPDDGGRDWGQRYIDIDLSEQYVRMYGDDGSIIWESACVTGDVAREYQTPTGVNVVNGNKARDQTLYGLDYDEDGEPDYESHVDYWIPFVGNLIALHDADWRSNFGGTINQYNGSHGCINLPVDKAAQLYDLAQIGDVVVVHY